MPAARYSFQIFKTMDDYIRKCSKLHCLGYCIFIDISAR